MDDDRRTTQRRIQYSAIAMTAVGVIGANSLVLTVFAIVAASKTNIIAASKVKQS